MAKKKKPGKWAAIVDGLPRMVVLEEGTRREQIDEIKEKIREAIKAETGLSYVSASALARKYAMLRAEKDRLAEALGAVNAAVAAVTELAEAQFEVEGEDSVALQAEGLIIDLEKQPYASVVDRDALRAWAIANGLERSLTLAWGTTNSEMKKLLEKGLPEPAGVQAMCVVKLKRRSMTEGQKTLLDSAMRAMSGFEGM